MKKVAIWILTISGHLLISAGIIFLFFYCTGSLEKNSDGTLLVGESWIFTALGLIGVVIIISSISWASSSLKEEPELKETVIWIIAISGFLFISFSIVFLFLHCTGSLEKDSGNAILAELPLAFMGVAILGMLLILSSIAWAVSLPKE